MNINKIVLWCLMLSQAMYFNVSYLMKEDKSSSFKWKVKNTSVYKRMEEESSYWSRSNLVQAILSGLVVAAGLGLGWYVHKKFANKTDWSSLNDRDLGFLGSGACAVVGLSWLYITICNVNQAKKLKEEFDNNDNIRYIQEQLDNETYWMSEKFFKENIGKIMFYPEDAFQRVNNYFNFVTGNCGNYFKLCDSILNNDKNSPQYLIQLYTFLNQAWEQMGEYIPDALATKINSLNKHEIEGLHAVYSFQLTNSSVVHADVLFKHTWLNNARIPYEEVDKFKEVLNNEKRNLLLFLPSDIDPKSFLDAVKTLKFDRVLIDAFEPQNQGTM